MGGVIMNNTILMTEEFWRNSQFSIARYYGGCTIDGAKYIIVNKEGKDLFECTHEANKAGRAMAIPAGEPCDLIRRDFQPLYRKLGRDKFLEVLQANQGKPISEIKKAMKDYDNKRKSERNV